MINKVFILTRKAEGSGVAKGNSTSQYRFDTMSEAKKAMADMSLEDMKNAAELYITHTCEFSDNGCKIIIPGQASVEYNIGCVQTPAKPVVPHNYVLIQVLNDCIASVAGRYRTLEEAKKGMEKCIRSLSFSIEERGGYAKFRLEGQKGYVKSKHLTALYRIEEKSNKS